MYALYWTHSGAPGNENWSESKVPAFLLGHAASFSQRLKGRKAQRVSLREDEEELGVD